MTASPCFAAAISSHGRREGRGGRVNPAAAPRLRSFIVSLCGSPKLHSAFPIFHSGKLRQEPVASHQGVNRLGHHVPRGPLQRGSQ